MDAFAAIAGVAISTFALFVAALAPETAKRKTGSQRVDTHLLLRVIYGR
jgi:hypothetical protein